MAAFESISVEGDLFPSGHGGATEWMEDFSAAARLLQGRVGKRLTASCFLMKSVSSEVLFKCFVLK